MRLSLLRGDVQELILRHQEANEYCLKFDSIEYDAVEGRQFDVLGFNDEEYVEFKRFTY